MAGIKIVDLPALGRDLISTDLLELSLAGGTGSRKITGQEIMNASKLSVGNTPIINGAVGQVLFQGTGNVLQESANLFWDNANGRLGIGTSTPTRTLSVVGSGTSGFDAISFKGQYSKVGYLATDNAGAYLASGAGVTESYIGLTATSLTLQAASALIDFRVGASRGVIFSTGNWFIGSSATDAGFRLDVNGTARFSGAVTTPAFATSSGYLGVASGLGGGIFGLTQNDTLFIWNRRNNTSGDGIAIGDFNANGGSNTNLNVLNIGGSFQTAGTCVHNNLAITRTINLASGTQTVRGIYYNPTLTNTTGLTTHNAIETTAGNVIFNGGNVGIGTSTPVTALSVTGSEASGRVIQVRSSAGKPFVDFFTSVSIGVVGSATAVTGGSTNDFGLGTNGNATANLIFGTGAGYSERMRIFGSTGNIGINTTTDAGFRLDVNGTARISGDLSVPTGKITFQTSAFGIDCNTTTGVFDIRNNLGSLQNTRISFSQGTYLNIYQPTQSSTGITSGIINTISTPITYAWSSGTAQSNLFVLNPTINNTGTYSGTFRGFYYNPNLVSMTGTTHFAIHTTAGRVRFEGLPTSPTGLNAGDIYNDGGTLKIV